jgi:hypothetical protein
MVSTLVYDHAFDSPLERAEPERARMREAAVRSNAWIQGGS